MKPKSESAQTGLHHGARWFANSAPSGNQGLHPALWPSVLLLALVFLGPASLFSATRASASASPSPNGLLIGNIGSSREDGISVPLGDAAGFLVKLHPPDPRISGGQILWNIAGMANGVNHGRIEVKDGEFHVFADSTAVGAGSHLVEVFRDDLLLDSAVVPADSPLFRVAVVTSTDEPLGIRWDGPGPWRPFWRIDFLWPIPNRIRVRDAVGIPALSDVTLVRVSPVGVTQTDSAPWKIELTGANLPYISIVDQALLFNAAAAKQALAHRAKGGAVLQVLENKIIVSEIPPSPEVVLTLEMPPKQTGILVEAEPIHLELAESELMLTVVGTVGGRPGVNLGTASIRNTGRELELTANFERAGSPTTVVEVFNGNTLVGSAVLSAGQGITMLPEPPKVMPALEAFGFAPPALLPRYGGFEQVALEPRPSCFFGFTGPARFQINSIGRNFESRAEPFQELIGDRVRFLAETDQIKVESIQWFEIAAGWPGGAPLIIQREKLRIAPPELEPLSGLTLSPGVLVELLGKGFGTDIEDLSIVVVDEENPCKVVAPLELVTGTDTQVTARVKFVLPGAELGRLLVSRGVGRSGIPLRTFAGLQLVKPIWIVTDLSPGASSSEPVTLQVVPPPPGTTVFVGGPPTNGVLELYLSGNWPSGTVVRVSGKWHDETTGGGTYEVDVPEFLLSTDVTALQSAGIVADVLQTAMQQQAGADLDITVDEISSGEARLTIALTDGQIDCGFIAVIVNQPPGLPRLRVERAAHQVRVLWPVLVAHWILEQTDSLATSPVPWTEVPAPYSTNETDAFITVPSPVGETFFRLRRPVPEDVIINP